MNKIKEWLKTTPYKNYSIKIASADASFRKTKQFYLWTHLWKKNH